MTEHEFEQLREYERMEFPQPTDDKPINELILIIETQQWMSHLDDVNRRAYLEDWDRIYNETDE